MKRFTLPLIAIFAFSPLWAQDFPAPKPTETHKVLARDVGTWDADIKMFFMGANSPPVEYKGVETNELVSGGLFLRSTFTAKMGPRDFEGHGLLGYDPRSKEYKGTWVDSFSAAPMPMQGTYDADEKTMTMYITTIDNDSGEEFKQKQVTKYVDENTKNFTIFLLVEADDQTLEVKLMEMTAKKRK